MNTLDLVNRAAQQLKTVEDQTRQDFSIGNGTLRCRVERGCLHIEYQGLYVVIPATLVKALKGYIDDITRDSV